MIKTKRTFPLRFAILAWINIGVQFAFPLAVAFTPSVAGAKSEARFLQKSAEPQFIKTKPYVLLSGETPAVIAKRNNMTVEALRQLNQFRSFARGFYNLAEGDELDVPLSPLPEVVWDKNQKATEANVQQARENKLASLANRAGSFFNNNPNSEAFSSAARGIASSEASSQIQRWLSHFGTARVQLETDKHLSLKNSQLDLLVPLYDERENLAFTQGSIHRTDDRSQANLGMGIRHFRSDWMLGGNLFLDYDLSRNHARMGSGIEYWRDFLKLGLNSYLRLTNWKDSPDIKDYEERPANGWDLRAEGWLPRLPQLGAKLTYEQYYGREVGLFGKDKRQSNPHAITAGITYTPFPLMTVSAEQRQGKAGEHDTRVGLQFNYQPGTSWQHQLNPDNVAAMRSLMGSRYDLVDRNNNIVLEYRKKEVIRLHTAALVAGYAGEKKSLEVSVNSKYGLERIDWSGSALFAAGGKIIQDSPSSFSVILPDYQAAEGSSNTYILNGVATDKKGNASQKTSTQVTVTQAAISTVKSSLTPATTSLPADGHSQQQFVLNVKDINGQPVDIAASEISIQKQAKNRSKSTSTLTAFTRRAPGEYVSTLTAGTLPESLKIRASAHNVVLASANVELTADSATAMIGTFEVVANNAIADGKKTNKVKMTVVDAQNNPVPGQSITLTASHQAAITPTATSDDAGEAIISLTSLAAGDAVVTATVNGNSSKNVTVTFQPNGSTAQILDRNLTILPEKSIADGSTKKTVKVLVTDAGNNPVPDIDVAILADNGANVAAGTVKTDSQGWAMTTLTSTIEGISNVTAKVNTSSVTRKTIFTGNTATAQLTSVTPAAGPYLADGASVVTYTARVTDQYGNPLAGIPVDWKSDRDSGEVKFTQAQSLTNDAGEANTGVTSSRAYSVVVTASTHGTAKSASPIVFVADNNNGLISEFTSDRQTIIANGSDSATLRVKVEDRFGNPLSSVDVALSGGSDVTIAATAPHTDDQGYLQASLTSHRAGDISVQARLQNGQTKKLTLKSIADSQSATVSLSTSSATAEAGSTGVIVTAKVSDSLGNPVSGTSVAWRSDSNTIATAVSVTNEQGEAHTKLTGTHAQETTVTGQLFNGHSDNVKVTFTAGQVDAQHSLLSIAPQSITADGKTSAVASLRLHDRWDNPVSAQPIDWTADDPSIQFTASEKGNGLYQAQVRGTTEGNWTIQARTGAVNKQVALGLLANETSALIDKVTVYGADTVPADGQQKITLRTYVKDSHGNNKLKGVAVGWQTSLGNLSAPLSKTDDNGMAEITLTSTQAGRADVYAMLGGGKPVKADKSATFTAGSPSASQSSLLIAPSSIVAATESATVRVTLRDDKGNLLSGLAGEIALHFSTDLSLSYTAFKETNVGVYSAQLSGKKAGSTQVSARVKGVDIQQTANVTINADNSTAEVQGKITATPAAATVGSLVTYRAALADKQGNPLGAGIPVTWSANPDSELSAQITHTDDTGIAQVTVTRQKVGIARVSAILPSGMTAAPDVMFSADAADESHSTLRLAPSVIVAGKEEATLTLILRDKNGNLLSGQTVSAHSDDPSVVTAASVEDSTKPGYYRMQISGSKAVTTVLSVQVNGTPFSQTKTLTIKGDTSSWQLAEVTVDKTTLTAGDTHGVTYSARVIDGNGNALSGAVVSWQLSGVAKSFEPTSRTNDQGIATTTLFSETAGTMVMTAYLDDKNHVQAPPVTVVAAAIDAAKSTFSSNKPLIGADGKDTATLTVQLKDRYDNAIVGKSVTLSGAASLPGFTISTVTDRHDGSYTATATSTDKGQVTLTATADSVKVAASVQITVGAMTPDLRFDNAEQNVVYSKNYTGSQAVHGMPSGVQQQWSSVDTGVASVDNHGVVTLLKSGETRITVYTPGNAQYNPAMASYRLIVDKAQPQLQFAQGVHQTVYGDGFVLPALSSGDSKIDLSELAVQYSSSDDRVATIGGDGKVKILKAGSIKLIAQSPESAQYHASSAEYVLVITKAKLEITFADALLKVNMAQMASDSQVYNQKPSMPLPPDVKTQLTSSDDSVLKIDLDGTVKQYSPGAARIKLAVLADERYEASSGDYDLNIYGTPAMQIDSIQGTSLGKQVDVTSHDWQPYFATDELQIDWSANVDPYYLPEKVVVKVSNGASILAQQEYSKGHTASGKTTLKAQADWIGKKLTVSVQGYGYDNIASVAQERSVQTSVIDVKNIIASATAVLKHDVYITEGGVKDTYNTCRTSSFRTQRDVYLDYNVNIVPLYPSEATLFGHNISLIIDNYTRTNEGSTYQWDHEVSSAGNSGTLRFTSSGSGINDQTLLVSDCWGNHLGGMDDQGTVGVILNIEYGGKLFTLTSGERMRWSGDSGSSEQSNVNLVVR
ncbi:TPA: hypothetical protein MEA92_004226 [Klebsiella aerogenes]|nr:hypothetical protein [Klebsiella aerogenes]